MCCFHVNIFNFIIYLKTKFIDNVTNEYLIKEIIFFRENFERKIQTDQKKLLLSILKMRYFYPKRIFFFHCDAKQNRFKIRNEPRNKINIIKKLWNVQRTLKLELIFWVFIKLNFRWRTFSFVYNSVFFSE